MVNQVGAQETKFEKTSASDTKGGVRPDDLVGVQRRSGGRVQWRGLSPGRRGRRAGGRDAAIWRGWAWRPGGCTGGWATGE